MQINKILITGVAGFIGSNLLDFLLKKTSWDIVGIDNLSTGSKNNIAHQLAHPKFKFIEANVSSIDSIKEYDCIFHLAALPRIQPSFEFVTEHINENLVCSMHLIELMIKENYFPKFVFSSSSAIYGTPSVIPTPESEKIDCLSPYAFQKYEVEKYLELLSERYPLDYICLRYFNPYGPRSFNPENKFNAYSSVVGIFLYRKEKGQKLLVTGDGSQKRDFIHVADLAKANYLAAINPNKLNTAFNIGNGSTLSVLELAKLISGKDYEFIPKREGESDITFADVKKAIEILGWHPEQNMEDYLKNN
ncbi:MAG: NAD-dependent epimerase/dehydratase family protein [Bacteroidetes bacterium]|nr:NAD-dependent epimerase/dehydratase family protein [Bacteroidota bacterium]